MSISNEYQFIIYTLKYERSYFDFWHKAILDFPEQYRAPEMLSYDLFKMQESTKNVVSRILCIRQDKIIGTIEFNQTSKNIIEIHYYYVLPKYRGIGIELALFGFQTCINFIKNSEKQVFLLYTYTWPGYRKLINTVKRICKVFLDPLSSNLYFIIFPLYSHKTFRKFLTDNQLWDCKKLWPLISLNNHGEIIILKVNLDSKTLVIKIVIKENAILYYFKDINYEPYKIHFGSKPDIYKVIYNNSDYYRILFSYHNRKLLVIYKDKPIIVQLIEIPGTPYLSHHLTRTKLNIKIKIEESKTTIKVSSKLYTIFKEFVCLESKLLIKTYLIHSGNHLYLYRQGYFLPSISDNLVSCNFIKSSHTIRFNNHAENQYNSHIGLDYENMSYRISSDFLDNFNYLYNGIPNQFYYFPQIITKANISNEIIEVKD